MFSEHQITSAVYAAKADNAKADALIKDYIPFIRSQASKFMSRPCTDQDDEYSIALAAFYEAIMSYEKERGAFLNFCGVLIRSRLIDFTRKEARHQGHISIYEEISPNDEQTLLDTLPDKGDVYEENATREATKKEIEELSAVMQKFGISFADVADNCPKQERTFNACMNAVRYARENPSLLNQLLTTKKLPLLQLVKGTNAERKTLERHRKYIVAMLLIHTNGYEIIRSHLKKTLNQKGGAAK